MKPKMARKPRPTDEVSSPPLSPTSGRLVHKKRRIESESVSPDRKMSTSSAGDKGPKSPKFSSPKESVAKECKVPKPLSPLPPLLLDDQQPCSSLAPVTTVQAPPEFLAFNYKLHCPALSAAIKADEPLPHIKSEVLRDLQHELEAMLAHTMDFMRRAAGDLQFLDTGDYPTVNLKKREMPVYQMRVLASPMSPTTQVHHEISLRSLLVPSIAPDDDVDVWPPPHLGTRYQSWLMMEKTERTIDKATLDDFEQFMNNEINELDMEYVDVLVPEFRHRLHYTNSLEMFSSFERRLHDHALQLQQLQIEQTDGLRVLHTNCAKSSSWWTHPIASLGAAEAFSKNYRAKYDTFVSERRVKMMKINMLPSLRYQSYEDKHTSTREEALLEENKALKKQLEEAKKSVEKEGRKKDERRQSKTVKEDEKKRKDIEQKQKEKKQTPVTPSKSAKKKSEEVSKKTSSSKTSPTFKPTTPSKVKPSTSCYEEKKEITTWKEFSRETTGGARFVMVVEDERGRRRVVPLAANGQLKEEKEDPCRERTVTLMAGDLHKPITINLPLITDRFERRSARVESRSRSRRIDARSRSRVRSLARIRHLAVAVGRGRSAPPPPREKYTMEMMKRGAKEIKQRFGLRRCSSVRALTLNEARRGVTTSEEGEKKQVERNDRVVKKTPVRKASPMKKQSLHPLPSPRKASPLKKSPQKKNPSTPSLAIVSSPKKKQLSIPLSQMERLQQRHSKAATAVKPHQKAVAVVTIEESPSPTPTKIAATPKTSSSAKQKQTSPPIPSSPSKPTPTLPKSPEPSPTTTSSSSAPLAVTTRTSARRNQKVSSEERTTPSSAASPLPQNGVDHGDGAITRRSTRDRKPSLKIQQRELPLDQYLPTPNSSRKNSRVPLPTPEPPEDREPFAIPTDPAAIPLLLHNGLGLIKEESPQLSAGSIKPATRRQTRNSMDAASLPPVLQVQQVLLQEQQAQLQQQKKQTTPPTPSITTPPTTRSRRGTISISKDTVDTPLLLTSAKDDVVTPRNGIDSPKDAVESPKSPVNTPKKIQNGLSSPMTRRRASLEEKEKKEEHEIEFLKVVKLEKNAIEIKKAHDKTVKNTKKKVVIVSPKKNVVQTPAKPVCLCLERLEELKKSGKKVCMKQLDKWIKKKGMVVKVRFMPRTSRPKREMRVEILEKCLHSIITPSPTRYMLSEDEKKKMELEMGKKITPIVHKKPNARLRRADIKREQRAKQWVSAIWYNLKQAERIVRRKMREAEQKRVCVMVQRVDGKRAVKVVAVKSKECERRRGVKRVPGWRKILKKKGKKMKKVEDKKEKNDVITKKKKEKTTAENGKIASKSIPKAKEIKKNSDKVVERKKEEKKEKKVGEPSNIIFKGRMPKLIGGEEQWKQFIRKGDKTLVAPKVVEEVKTDKKKKKASKSPVKNSPKKSGKAKKTEEEVEEVVIKIGKSKDQKKGQKTRRALHGTRPNGLRMKMRRRGTKKSAKTVSRKKSESKQELNSGKKKDVRLTLEQMRNRYLIAPEERLTAAAEDKMKKGRRQLVKIIRKVLALPDPDMHNKQMKILRALARHKRRNENEGPQVIPTLDLSVPPFNEKRQGAGWPVEWAIPKPLRAPGVYRRRKLRAVRRAERKREKERMEKEKRDRVAKTAVGIKPLRPMPWTKTTKGKGEEPEGKVNVLKCITKTCAMKENGDTAQAICEMKAKAREKVMDVIFDAVFSGGKIHARDESVTSVVEEPDQKFLEQKNEKRVAEKEEKKERPRRGSIRGKKDLIKDDHVSDEEKEKEEIEDEEMNETLEYGENEEEMEVTNEDAGGAEKVNKKKKKKKPVVKIEPTLLCKNEVAIELAVSQREYKRELDNYARMLKDIFYILGAREHQIRARKNLEEKEDALAHLHAKFYREVPRRLPNEQEMEQIAKALSERREALEEAFGANLWRQPRIQPEHPAWLTAEYNPGAKRQDKYNYFVDWDYDQKREIMRAHEKMWAAATSHHLPHGDAYGKYDVGVNREMEGEEKTLFEWEKNLVGALVVGRRKEQMRMLDPRKNRFRSLPKRPPTAASLKKKAEIEKKKKEENEREEKEMEEEERREAQRDIYTFDSEEDDDKPKAGRDEWEVKEEEAMKRMEERVEKKETPPFNPFEPIASTEKKKSLQQRWQRWSTMGKRGERNIRIKLEEDDFAEEEEEEEEEDSSLGMEHASSVESSTLMGTLSVKTDDAEEGTEVKVKKTKKKKSVQYDSDGDRRVDRRKVGGLELPSSIAHLDPMIFLKLIPDNRSHKKGQGKKAMLKQIMIEYAKKEAAGGGGRGANANRSPAIPSRPQCTQQQLMSPGGTTAVAPTETPARPRRSLVSPQGSELSERRRERSDSTKERPAQTPKSKKRKEPVEEEEEVMPSRNKKDSRARVTSPVSSPKLGRRSCTRKARKLIDDDDEEDDISMKVPYTPASRRGGEAAAAPPHHPAAPAAAATARSPSVQSTPVAPLSPPPVRSCRRKGPVKYEDEEEPLFLSSRPTTRKLSKKVVKQEIVDNEYPV